MLKMNLYAHTQSASNHLRWSRRDYKVVLDYSKQLYLSGNRKF